MRGYLRKFMVTHKHFVEAVGGFLIRKKGYMDFIVQSQTPIDEVAIVLLARMWKIHVCVFLEGKYWTTNKDLALNKASIYLIYVRKNTFYDTTRKGSLHWSLVEAPDITYNLCKPKTNFPEKSTTPAPVGHKTLNSLRARLMDDKAKLAAEREYKKLNAEPKQPKKPVKKTKSQGKLKVQHHGIPKRQPRTQKLKCPVCKELFILIKELNTHVQGKHKSFHYKCAHCTKKFFNYSSCYKHQK